MHAGAMASDGVQWQGGAEFRDDMSTRVGGLYLIEDALLGDFVCFLEGGRHGAFVAAKTVAGAGVVLINIPICVELYAQVFLGGHRGAAPALAEMLAGIAAVGCFVLAAIVYRRAKVEHEAMLAAVAEDVGELDHAVLLDMCTKTPGCLSIPVGDLERVTPEGDDVVELRTRLDDVLKLRVFPDRDAFVAKLGGVRSPRAAPDG